MSLMSLFNKILRQTQSKKDFAYHFLVMLEILLQICLSLGQVVGYAKVLDHLLVLLLQGTLLLAERKVYLLGLPFLYRLFDIFFI